MSSGKGLTLVKTTLLLGQNGVTVVASLPTNQSCDVTTNIPIGFAEVHIMMLIWWMYDDFTQNT